jgi:hypothetical protein
MDERIPNYECNMKEFFTNLKHEIESKIHTIESTENTSLERIKLIITCLDGSLRRLKKFIIHYEFTSREEEVLFFKELKPQIYGKLLYYVRLFKMEEKRPSSNKVSENIFLSEQIKQLNLTFTNSLDFYKYYRSGDTSMDEKYFVREMYDWTLDIDPLSFDKDHEFSTSYDYEVANIIANDLLKAYLVSELKTVGDEVSNQMISLISEKQLQWTDSKVSLIELVYGIYSSGSINHGVVELKDLVMCFEALFNMKMGDFYRTFIEIRERKKSRTQYIDQMKNTLIRRMDMLDG